MNVPYLLLYLFVASALGCLLMGIDKWKAKRGMWRISEKTLFLVALFGGALGSTIGMHVFHHKTRHWYFKFGFPTLALLQLALLAAYTYWLTFLRS